jgi:SAM-dependent methyltransferase
MPRNYRALLEEIDLPQLSREGSFEGVLELADRLARGRALDAPCGPGLLSEALRRIGFEVTAADLRAAAFGARETVPFCAVDLDAPLPFRDASFELVVCGDGIEHLENPFAAFREFRRVLGDSGTLIVATPNYLNIERRLKFLWSGSLTKPLARRTGPLREDKADRGHINPLTLIRMAQLAESAGLELVRSETLLRKRGQYWLAPIALLIRCFRPFLSREYARNLFADHTFTLKSLLGGKKLVALFRKQKA